jgi:hypothetical protein
MVTLYIYIEPSNYSRLLTKYSTQKTDGALYFINESLFVIKGGYLLCIARLVSTGISRILCKMVR